MSDLDAAAVARIALTALEEYRLWRGASAGADRVRAFREMQYPTPSHAASPDASGTPHSASPEVCDCGHTRECHNALAESFGRRSCSLCPCMTYGVGRPSQHGASPEASQSPSRAAQDTADGRECPRCSELLVVDANKLPGQRHALWCPTCATPASEREILRTRTRKLRETTSELARVQWLADERQRQLDDEARVIETWRQENATLRAQLTEVQRERDEWEGHYHAAEKHNEILRDSVEGHGETIRTLRAARDAALARVQRERDEAVRRAEDEANARIREAERTIATLRAERDAALARVQRERDEALADAATWQAYANRADAQTDAVQCRCDNQRQRIGALARKRDEARAQLATAEQSLAGVRERIEKGQECWRDSCGHVWVNIENAGAESIYGPFTRGRFVADTEVGK